MEPEEIGEWYGLDVTNFVYGIRLYRYRELVGIRQLLTGVMVEIIDLEECEPIGRC